MMQAMPVSTGTANGSAAGATAAGASATGLKATGAGAAALGVFADVLSAQAGGSQAKGTTPEGGATESRSADGAGAGRGRGGKREDETRNTAGRGQALPTAGMMVAAVPVAAAAVADAAVESGAGAAGTTDGGSTVQAAEIATGAPVPTAAEGVADTELEEAGGPTAGAGVKPGRSRETVSVSRVQGREDGSFAGQLQQLAAANGEAPASVPASVDVARLAAGLGVAAGVPGGIDGMGAVPAAGGDDALVSRGGVVGRGAARATDRSQAGAGSRGAGLVGERAALPQHGAVPAAMGQSRTQTDAGSGGAAGRPKEQVAEVVAGKGKAGSARGERSTDGDVEGASETLAAGADPAGAVVPGQAVMAAMMATSAAAPLQAAVGAGGRTAETRSGAEPGPGMGLNAGGAGGDVAQRAGTAGAGQASAVMSDVAASRLLHTAAGTELRVGTRLGDLGSVQIRTVFGRDQMQAHIAVESEHLRSALSAHLGGLEDALGGRTGQAVRATVSVGMEMGMDGGRGGEQPNSRGGQGAAETMAGASGGTGSGAGGGRGGPSNDRSRGMARGVSEMAAVGYGTGASGGGGGGGGSGRLDVRV